jgi:hypothetical protein
MNANQFSELLKMTWAQQAAHLRGLSRKDLEVLWFEIQRHEEVFDRMKLAVFSILRDHYESQVKEMA